MASKARDWALPSFLFSVLTIAACGTANDADLTNTECPTPEETTASATTGGDETTSASSQSASGATSTSASATTGGTGGSTGTGPDPGPDPDPVPPSAQEIFARLHGCNKIRYQTLGQMLTQRGGALPVKFAQSSGVACQTDNRTCTSSSQCASGLDCIGGLCGVNRNVNGVGTVFFPDPVTDCERADEACFCPNGTCSGGIIGPNSNGVSFVRNPTGICVKDDNQDGVINQMDGVMAEILSFGGNQNICQKDNNGNVREFAMGGNQGCKAPVGQPGDPNYDPGESCYCPETPCFSNPSSNSSDQGKTGFCVPKVANAAFLYATARDTFGVPAFDSRQGETDGHTTASALRLFDLFVMVAPNIIDNISDPQKAPACTRNGQNPSMFAGDGSCSEDAISCLIGYPATSDHTLLCNLIVNKANPNDSADVARKREIAVATLLSAAHSCE